MREEEAEVQRDRGAEEHLWSFVGESYEDEEKGEIY